MRRAECPADKAYDELAERNPELFKRFTRGGDASSRAEDGVLPVTAELRIHDDHGHSIVLEGNWIGALFDEGVDEYGLYFDVRIRRSRFKPSDFHIYREQFTESTPPTQASTGKAGVVTVPAPPEGGSTSTSTRGGTDNDAPPD